LTTIDLTMDETFTDNQWEKLIHHLPSNIRSFCLSFSYWHDDISLTIQAIGLSFPRLETLDILIHGSRFPPCVKLAEVVGNLSDLWYIGIIGLPVGTNSKEWWKLLVEAIRKKPRLEIVFFHESEVSREDLELMQFGPFLNQMKSEHKLVDPPQTIEQLVDALIAVRSRVDCVDYFLSRVAPTLYAEPALSGLVDQRATTVTRVPKGEEKVEVRPSVAKRAKII
jgi:hypothetical protein